jgi:hypothetical protein
MTIEGENVWLAAGMGQETKAFAQFGGVPHILRRGHAVISSTLERFFCFAVYSKDGVPG